MYSVLSRNNKSNMLRNNIDKIELRQLKIYCFILEL